MALIRFDGENHSTADTWVVAVYDTDRHYGGPEEGDWYYDSRVLVAVAPVADVDDALRVVAEMEAGAYQSTGNRFNVNYSGTGHYSMCIVPPGDEIIHKSPTERPHYE